MKGFLSLIIFVFLLSCKSEKTDGVAKGASEISLLNPKEVIKEDSLSLKVYDFDSFEPILYKEDNKTYVINFWATWCKPCIEELPYFEQLLKEYKDKNVEVILVSLDLPRMYRSHLVPFIEREKLQSEIVVLDDPKQNVWIPKVDKEWSGAIPATLIYNKNKREFFEESFDYASLEKNVQQFLK